MTDERKLLEQAADDILQCVVCRCGNYRHHGVGWMPDDSGEGLPRVLEILAGLSMRQPQGEPRGAAYLSTLPACRQCGRVGVALYQDLCCHCDGREVGR